MPLMMWETLHATLAGYECLWADLDGLHLTDAPTQAPHTSWLWAWQTTTPAESNQHEPGQVLVRARLDHDNTQVRCFVARLHLNPEDDHAHASAGASTGGKSGAPVVNTTLRQWPAADQRLKNLQWHGPVAWEHLRLESVTEAITVTLPTATASPDLAVAAQVTFIRRTPE